MRECPACKRCFPDHVNHCPHDGDATTHSIPGEPMLDGRYQLEMRLGHGGMGVVFKARHIFLKTAHAIKVILPDLVGNDPMLVTRFRQEALAAAAIRHTNIIAVTDFGVARGTMPFLVMEFVEGRSLHDLLVAEKSLPPGRAFELISAIGAGVAAAHRQNIVHRDLKPLNIMMQNRMSIAEGLKILDFGLAKIKSGELLGSFVQAKTSGLMGSPFYMAPEQWSDEEPDARADIYSLAVIMFQMLGGEVPFKGTSIPSIMKKHLTAEPPTFAALGVQIPAAIEAAVRHGLEKEALDRPASVDAFIKELREAIASASHSLARTQVGRIDSGTFTTLAPTEDTPPQAPMATSDDLPVSLGSSSIEDYKKEESSASLEAKRLREQAALLEERARKAQEAQKREQERLEHERLEHERSEKERREIEERDRIAREELEREEAFRLQAQAEARRKAEEEIARQRAAEVARLRAEQEAKQRAEEEARLRAEQEARLRAEEDARRRAEEDAARLRAEVEARQRAEAERIRAAAEEAERRATEENARQRAEEDVRRRFEEEARQHEAQVERERQAQAEQARIEREERERAQKQLASTSVEGFEQSPDNVDFETTQQQRLGTTTQAIGEDSLPGVAPPLWQAQSQPGFGANSASSFLSEGQPTKSKLPLVIAATVVGFFVLVGGAVGVYMLTKPSAEPAPTNVETPNSTGGTPVTSKPPETDVKPEQFRVEGGTFQMGREGGPIQEGPPRSVKVAPFALDATEVTNAEYADFVQKTNRTPPTNWDGNKPKAGQEQWPVTNVTVDDANAFAEWRSQRDGAKYRLPTEEEWEYAARGGDQGLLYPWGNSWIDNRAVLKGAGPPALKPVGSFPEGKTRWGQLDMIGNAWEWTSSKASYYAGNALIVRPDHKKWTIIRGGSAASEFSGDKAITNAYRDWVDPTTKNELLGFRLVREG